MLLRTCFDGLIRKINCNVVKWVSWVIQEKCDWESFLCMEAYGIEVGDKKGTCVWTCKETK